MFSSSNSSGNPIFSLVFVIVFFCVIGFLMYKSKKARKEIIDYCKKNGITYQDKIINIPIEVRKFSFINIGDERTFDCIMSMNKQQKKIFLFNVIAHSYKFKGGNKNLKHSCTNGGTICLIVPNKTNNNSIPSFYLKDRNRDSLHMLDALQNLDPDTIYEKFGGTNIGTKNNQDFSNKFILKGHSEEEVDEFLSPNKINYLLTNHIDGYRYEIGNNSLMVFTNTFYGLDKRLDMLKYSLNLFDAMYNS